VDFGRAQSRIKRFPFAPLIWDFMRRAMPYDRPGRLTNDEVYALTAYLLFRNGIIEETDVLDAKSLARIQMPHRAEYTPPPPWRPSGAPRMFKILP
jgi:cytochrome c